MYAHYQRNGRRQNHQSPQRLRCPSDSGIVKQALFNSLAGRVAGAEVLELFAGSGALGLNASAEGRSALRVSKRLTATLE